MLRLWVLGSWRAEINEHPVPRLPTRHARALLARLALLHPRPLERTQIHRDLFPNTTPESAARSLRTTLYYLRRALPVQILSEDDQLALNPSLTVDVDVMRFEQASVSGATQSMLEAAVELYRGPFLQSSDGWAYDEAERLRRLYVDVLQRLIALNQASGNVANMADAAQRWAHEEPWNEEAVLAVVQAYVAQGDRHNALTQLKAAHALLDRTSTAPRLRTTFDQLGRAAARLPSFKPSPPTKSADRNFTTIDFGRSMLVGRQDDLDQLMHRWAIACGGTPQVLTLEGETGIGKSRLVHELVTHVRSCSEHLALIGHGSIRTNDHALGMLRTAFAYIPETYRAALQTAAESISDQAWNVVSLYPEFRALAPDRETGYLAPLDAASEVTRRHTATMDLLDAIMAQGCLLLVLEDAYPGDAETRRIIDALMVASRRVLVLRTRRISTCDEPAQGPVRRLAALGKESMRMLVAAAFDGLIVPTTLDRIVAWSEGNPLQARELIRALMLSDHLRRDANGRWRMPSHDVRKPDLNAALPLHQEVLSPQARELVHLLAVLGRPVDAPMLERLVPNDEQHVRDELLAHHFLIEAHQGLMFERTWTRDTILASLDAAEKQMLHARIASVLRSMGSSDPAEQMIHEAHAHAWEHAWTAAIAAAKQAWSEHQLRAMEHALRIAEQAIVELGASSGDERRWELLSLKEQYAASTKRGEPWSQALEKLQRFADAHHRADWRVEALVRNGRALREQGRLPEAEPLLHSAAEQARRAGLRGAEARARTSLAAVLEDRGAVSEAVREQRIAVDAVHWTDDRMLQVHTLGVLAYMQMRAGQIAEAFELNTQVLGTPEVQRQPVLQARFARHQGVIMLADRRFEEGLQWLRRSVGQSQQIGDLFGLLTGQTSLVYYHALLGLHNESMSLGEVLVPQVRKDQARTHLCWLLYALARTSFCQGDASAAAALARESADLGEAVGDFDGAAGGFALAASVALHAHRLSEAVVLIEHALRCAALVDRPTVIVAHIAATVWLAANEPLRARTCAYQALQQAREPGLASVYAIEALHDVARVLTRVEVPVVAQTIHEEAYRLLVNDVVRIMSPVLRRAYINASHAHRTLATSHGSGAQRLALLPLYTAPRGRPLHADEVVPVVWTIRDEATSSATTQTARRRNQVQRLVNEAAEQGAIATVEALAEALVVAPRTIQRDLHELRRQGIVIDTRGTH